MKRTLRHVAAALGALTILLASTAASADSAEVPEGDGQDYGYAFFDDYLDGSQYGGHGMVVKPRTLGTRRVLLRPRVSFVKELLDSVEQM